jgi:TolC family type I secretion outer membrane protein
LAIPGGGSSSEQYVSIDSQSFGSIGVIMRRAFVASFVLGMLLPAYAAADDLNDALKSAYLNNPNLKAARAELQGTDEGVAQARAGWRPTVTAEATAGISRQSDVSDATVNPAVSRNRQLYPQTYNVTLSQPLYSGGGTVAAVSGAKNDVEAGRAKLRDTEAQVFLDAVDAYVGVTTAEATVKLRVTNVGNIKRTLQEIKDRVEAGEQTNTDVAEAEAELASAEADLRDAQGSLAVARTNYRVVVGQMPVNLEPAKFMAKSELPIGRADAIAKSKDAPQVAAASFSVASAKDQIDAEFSKMLPDLSLQASVSRSDQFTSDGFPANPTSKHQGTVDATVMAVLKVPLYQAGLPDSRVRQAKAGYQRARELLDEARNEAAHKANQAWESFDATKDSIGSYRDEVKARKAARIGIAAELKVGQREVTDLLSAETSELRAQTNLVNAEGDLTRTQYRVMAAIGRLSAKDLGLDVKIYAPEAHYDAVADKFIGTGPSIDPPAPAKPKAKAKSKSAAKPKAAAAPAQVKPAMP